MSIYTKSNIEQLCKENGTQLIEIDSSVQELYSRDTKATVQCCVHGCDGTVSKSFRNFFINKNFGCEKHAQIFKGQKIKKTKGDLNLKNAIENDNGERYTHKQLSILECRPSLFNICHQLHITNYHNLQKSVLIDAILKRQNELNTKCTIEEEGIEEHKFNIHNDGIADNIFSIDKEKEDIADHILAIEEEGVAEHEFVMEEESTQFVSVDLTKDFKSKLEKQKCFFQYNGVLWIQARKVAQFLEYKDIKTMLKHVSLINRIEFQNFPKVIRNNILHILHQTSNCSVGMQPRATFVNEKGLCQILNRSNKPVATGTKRKLEEVYVATTSDYESKGVYKIGKSENSKKRVSNVNVSRLPEDEMYLRYVATCDDAVQAEKMIHSILSEYRVVPNREFFKLSIAEITNVVDNVCMELNQTLNETL